MRINSLSQLATVVVQRPQMRDQLVSAFATLLDEALLSDKRLKSIDSKANYTLTGTIVIPDTATALPQTTDIELRVTVNTDLKKTGPASSPVLPSNHHPDADSDKS